MLLKRHHRLPKGWQPQLNVRDPATGTLTDPRRAEGVLLNPPPLDHIELRHTGTTPEQNFSARLVEAATAEGWMRIGGGKIVLDVKPEPLTYTVERGPGCYCCHCGEPITEGLRHVAEAHSGKASPDANNPSGYRRINHYECTLDAKAHKKYAFRQTGRAR